MNPADELATGVVKEMIPGAGGAMGQLDPMRLLQLLKQILGGGQQPAWGRGGAPTDPGGSALKEQMMKQQIEQLSGPGGMGY